jgi:hypothetical protein
MPAAAAAAKAPSIVRARIPNIPRGKDNWRKAVEQWDTLLRDWPEENYTGEMRTTAGMKRSLRQTIAEEYERWVWTSHLYLAFPHSSTRFGRDDEAFLAVYGGAAARGVSVLAQAIREAHNRNRTSKNGTPEERKSRRAS